MAKVDRLGWTAGLSFNAYGASVGIRTNDAAILERVPEIMPPEWERAEAPVVDSLFSLWVGKSASRQGRRHYHLLYSGAARLTRTLDIDEVFHDLENYLLLTVAYWAKEDHLFVHAGVVGWQGQAILIPGRSHTGKTTLVSELIKAGAMYFSDEMAVLDPAGRVHPYPIPLSVREDNGTCKYSPDEFGATIGEEPLPVGLILVTEYQEGARWQPRRLTPARAMMALLDNTVAARKDPKVSLPILGQTVDGVAALKTRRGEAANVAPKILRFMSAQDMNAKTT
ncbi:MAG: hypothetical protein J5I90_16390 [Caldilineales bacterium]|nr:hypothetical protein [Caldilineales bacterium]